MTTIHSTLGNEVRILACEEALNFAELGWIGMKGCQRSVDRPNRIAITLKKRLQVLKFWIELVARLF